MGGTDLSLSAPGSQTNGNNELAIALQGAQLPFQANSVLPARPNLPDDPVIPHNGFATAEEGEKAFMHLLRKAGVDANWTWDQTMRTIITDPLYKALNTLAEKKAAWQKVRGGVCRTPCHIYSASTVHRQPSSEGAGRARRTPLQAAPRDQKHAQGEPECLPLQYVRQCRQAVRATSDMATGEV